MKIISIKSNNINALKGVHEIDFSSEAFQNNIFAIVGKTGSGKTTLLDIITLALYAQTNRLGRDIEQVITQDTHEAWCEVSFTHQGQSYLSKITLQKEAQKTAITMSLFQGETPIIQGRNAVPQKITEIIGLDFNSFSHAILLPQGLFHRLLYAPAKERLLLLEQINDTQLYADISQKVYQESLHAQETFKSMEQALKDLPHLDPQVRQALEERLKKLSQEKANYDIDKLIYQINQKRSFDKASIELEAHKASLEKLQKSLVAKQFQEKEYHDFIRFSVNEKKKIEQTKLLDHELEFSQKNLRSIHQEIASVEEELKQVNHNITQNDEKLSSLRVKETLLKKELEGFQNITHLQQNHTLILSKFNERLRYQQQLQQLTQGEEQLDEKPLAQELATLEERASTLEKKIKAQQFEKLEQQNLILENKITKLTTKASLEQTRESLLAQKKELKESIDQLLTQNLELENRLYQTQKMVRQLEEKYALEEKILNYEEDRAKLKENSPCPLCGSTQHPLFEEQVEPSKTHQLLEEQKAFEQQLQTQYHEQEKIIVQKRAKIEQLEEQLQQNNQQSINLHHLKGDLPALQEEQALLQKELQSIQYQRDELTFVTERKQQLKEQLLELRILIQKHQNRKRQEEEIQLKIQELSYYLIKTLRLYDIELDNQSINLLNAKKESYQRLSFELKAVQQAIHPIEGAKIQNDAQKSYIEESLLSLKKRASMQECDILLLQQKRFAILEERSTTEVLQSLEQASKKQQASYDLFRKLKEEFNHKKSLYFSLLEQLDKQQKLKLINLEQLEKERDAQEIKLAQINQEMGAIQHQIAQDDEYLKRCAKEQQSLEEQAQIAQEWEELNQLIGSPNGDKYRHHVQRLTLQQLIKHANRHLKRLNHRYLLAIKEEDALELEIEDHAFEHQRRAIPTLSGGESFVVSLALALGLLDLKSHDVQINTLFLDEGFESLDEESLQEVLHALSTLETQGKTIGIVSHTPLLQTTIETQIRVEKQGDGISQIKLNLPAIEATLN